MSKLQVETISHTNNTTAQTIDSSGRITLSSARPHVFCRGFGSVTTATATINGQTMDGSWGIAHSFDSVDDNQGNHFDNSTGLFRVPITGVYFLSCGFGQKSAENYVGWGIVTGTASDHGNTGLQEAWLSNDSSEGTNHGGEMAFCKVLTAGNDVCAFFRETTYAYPHTTTKHFHFSVTFLG
jgi:hypothetical protein